MTVLAMRRRYSPVVVLVLSMVASIAALATDLPDRLTGAILQTHVRNGFGLMPAKMTNSKTRGGEKGEFDAAVGELLRSVRNRTRSSGVQSVTAPLQQTSTEPRRSSSPWTVTPAENGTPRQMRRMLAWPSNVGGASRSSVIDLERQVWTFLQEEAAALKLTDPAVELELLAAEIDDLGRNHFRFQQRHAGLPVWPTGLSVHLDPAGETDLVDAAIVPTPSGLNLVPAITDQSAVMLAKTAVPGGYAGINTSPVLVIYAPFAEPPALAWRLRIMVGPFHSWTSVISARTGKVLLLQSDSQNAAVQGSGAGVNGTFWTFPVWSANGGYYLIDTTKPSYRQGTDPVTNPQGVIAVFDLFNRPLKSAVPELSFSTTPNQWESGDAVSALVNLGFTYDCFLNVFQRNGISGKGGNLFAVVRSGGLANAQYHTAQGIMEFGDAEPYAGSLDVVAHELTHGVTASSARLVYRGQSGALNEAFSDIFGEFVENYAYGTHDWLLGSALSSPARDMKEPGRLTFWRGLPYPSSQSQYVNLPFDEDNGGVHVNSSIINRAFYLLAEGLPNSIGLLDAASVFYRCLTVHLQPQSQFIDCRLGCLAAAAVLFPQDPSKVTAVGEAFDAVGIVDLPPTPQPGSLPPVNAPDSALAISFDLASALMSVTRRESALGDPLAGSTKILGAKTARIAVTGDGSEFAFVSTAFDLCHSLTVSPGESLRCLGVDGAVFSVAISADASRFAAVKRDRTNGEPQGLIWVTDGTESAEYQLLAPVLDGVAVDTVRFAEHLSFSPDGRSIVYDALSVVHFGNGPTVERWSLYLLDLETGLSSVVVPPLEEFDVANPVFGHTSDRMIAFEGRQLSTGNSAVLIYDRFAGTVGVVGEVKNGFGYPEFTGDDRAVVYATRDGTAAKIGFSLVRQDISGGGVAPVGNPTLWLHDAVLGVVYRRGAYRGVNERPTVSLVSQPSVAAVTVGTAVTLTASASDPDGHLAGVEFWSGGTRIAVDTVAPFSVNISSIGAGSFNFVARAVDTFGMTSDSQTIRMVATLPVKKLALRPQENGTMLLDVEAPQGSYLIEGSVDLLAWGGVQSVNIGPSGKETFVYQPAAGGTRSFLRLR